MDFSSISQNTTLGQLLRLPLRYVPTETVLPVLQGKLRGYKWIAGSSNHGCWLGSYEYKKQQVISKVVRPRTVAFDIGAHVGYYSLLFSHLTGSEGKVFAFEPLPANVEYLQRHIVINRALNVEVLEVAVADTTGTASFQKGASSSMGHLAECGDFEVEQVTIDELMNRGKLSAPDYLKIDIEGAEFKAFLGAEVTIREFHPIIFLATHGKDVHQDCCDFLRSFGYALQPLDGNDIQSTNEILAIRDQHSLAPT